MNHLTRAFSDLMFAIQAAGAALWCIASWRKILGSTQGASMSYFLLFEGYVIFQISLLWGAYRHQPSRSTKQVMAVCGVWMLMLPPCIIALLTGHVTIATDFVQMWIDARHYGWDRNRTWFLVAEIGNEVSWLAATIVWLLR